MSIRRTEGVSFEPSGDRVIVLDADAQWLTTLDPIGAVIWSELDGVRGIPELARDLVGRFEGVDEATLAADLEEFVAGLAAIGLVEVD